MQSFTKNEIMWVAGELNKLASQMRVDAEKCGGNGLEAGMAVMRSEQYANIANRLSKAITDGNKRLEIKY